MHRHGYSGRKFSRERDQRLALLRSLSVALIEHGSIETTLPKAKELRPRVEKLVSKAKKGDLHNRRQLVSLLASVTSAHKLVDQIAPAMKRTSGYLRIQRTELRRGDNAQMARISFVDEIKDTAATSVKTSNEPKKKAAAPKATGKPIVKPATSKAPTIKQSNVAAKRTGRRGDK